MRDVFQLYIGICSRCVCVRYTVHGANILTKRCSYCQIKRRTATRLVSENTLFLFRPVSSCFFSRVWCVLPCECCVTICESLHVLFCKDGLAVTPVTLSCTAWAICCNMSVGQRLNCLTLLQSFKWDGRVCFSVFFSLGIVKLVVHYNHILSESWIITLSSILHLCLR